MPKKVMKLEEILLEFVDKGVFPQRGGPRRRLLNIQAFGPGHFVDIVLRYLDVNDDDSVFALFSLFKGEYQFKRLLQGVVIEGIGLEDLHLLEPLLSRFSESRPELRVKIFNMLTSDFTDDFQSKLRTYLKLLDDPNAREDLYISAFARFHWLGLIHSARVEADSKSPENDWMQQRQAMIKELLAEVKSLDGLIWLRPIFERNIEAFFRSDEFCSMKLGNYLHLEEEAVEECFRQRQTELKEKIIGMVAKDTTTPEEISADKLNMHCLLNKGEITLPFVKSLLSSNKSSLNLLLCLLAQPPIRKVIVDHLFTDQAQPSLLVLCLQSFSLVEIQRGFRGTPMEKEVGVVLKQGLIPYLEAVLSSYLQQSGDRAEARVDVLCFMMKGALSFEELLSCKKALLQKSIDLGEKDQVHQQGLEKLTEFCDERLQLLLQRFVYEEDGAYQLDDLNELLRVLSVGSDSEREQAYQDYAPLLREIRSMMPSSYDHELKERSKHQAVLVNGAAGLLAGQWDARSLVSDCATMESRCASPAA